MSYRVLRREGDGMWLNRCIEPGCGSMEFHLLLDLQYPAVECAKCGKRQMLIDSHTRLPVGHALSLSGLTDERGGLPSIPCCACDGTSFSPGTATPCKECFGTGKMQFDSRASREARRAKERQKKEDKELDPEK